MNEIISYHLKYKFRISVTPKNKGKKCCRVSEKDRDALYLVCVDFHE